VIVGVPPFGTEISVMAAAFPLEEKNILGSYYGSPRFRYDMRAFSTCTWRRS